MAGDTPILTSRVKPLSGAVASEDRRLVLAFQFYETLSRDDWIIFERPESAERLFDQPHLDVCLKELVLRFQ